MKLKEIELIQKYIADGISIKCSIVCAYCGRVGLWESHDFCNYSTERNAVDDASVLFFENGWRITKEMSARCKKCVSLYVPTNGLIP